MTVALVLTAAVAVMVVAAAVGLMIAYLVIALARWLLD